MSNLLQKIVALFKWPKDESTIVRNAYADYSHLYNADGSFTDAFYSNLVRTINWTEEIVAGIKGNPEINFATILRSENPLYEGAPFYRYDNTNYPSVSTPDLSFNYLTVLDTAMAMRKDDTLTVTDISQYGKILEFYIDVTTHDGAPCAESDGFVDESDIPPIDTWFYVTRTKLYCWIPSLFVSKMQSAIEVEILDSYHWIIDADPALQRLIMMDKLKTYNNELP